VAFYLVLASMLPAVLVDEPARNTAEATRTGPYTLSGPYTHDNLTLYLIHGKDQLSGKTFLTLQEALEQKKIIVHETKAVNELAVENVSPSEEVFVQAGDIVKGGQQDRVLAVDLIVPPKSGRIPIGSFCVEAGRWTQRGKENITEFESSRGQVPTNALKLAVRTRKSQIDVWDNVGAMQRMTAGGIRGSAESGEARSGAGRIGALQSLQSPTSLQLTLEHKSLQEGLKGYLSELRKIVDGKNDVVGYVAAVNGKVQSAEIYGSHELFVKLWPALLRGSAVAAVAERAQKGKAGSVTADSVKDFLRDLEKGEPKDKRLTDRLVTFESTTAAGVMFETRDRNQKEALLRRSYVGK
jgi:hypothetical protein